MQLNVANLKNGSITDYHEQLRRHAQSFSEASFPIKLRPNSQREKNGSYGNLRYILISNSNSFSSYDGSMLIKIN